MTVIVDPIEYPVRLFLDREKKIRRWVGDFRTLGVERDDAHESATLEKLFTPLFPGVVF